MHKYKTGSPKQTARFAKALPCQIFKVRVLVFALDIHRTLVLPCRHQPFPKALERFVHCSFFIIHSFTVPSRQTRRLSSQLPNREIPLSPYHRL